MKSQQGLLQTVLQSNLDFGASDISEWSNNPKCDAETVALIDGRLRMIENLLREIYEATHG
jgi:hypothetical protein